jgi:hypothetical protein
MTDVALTIERYAEMRADMDAGKRRDEVLAFSGLSVDAWTTQQSSWLQKMGAELEGGRFELSNRYTRAFLERQDELRKRATPPPAPIIEPVVPIVPVVQAVPAAPPAPVTEGGLWGPPPKGNLFVPDAASPWAATPEPREPKQDLGSTSFFQAVTSGPALPFQPGSAPTENNTTPSAPPAVPPPRTPRKKVDRSTQAISVVSLEDITPFDRSPRGQTSVPTQPLPQQPLPQSPTQSLQQQPPLQSQPPPPAPVAPPPPPARAKMDSALPPLDEDPFMSTIGFDGSAPLGPALPFEPSAAAKAPSMPARPPTVGPNIASVPPPATSDNNLVRPNPKTVQPQAIPAQRDSYLPPAPAREAPPLTLEQYASLCVELNDTPTRAAEIAARYGLTQPQWTMVNAYWQGRMTHEPNVRAAWEQACVTYRQWYMRR